MSEMAMLGSSLVSCVRGKGFWSGVDLGMAMSHPEVPTRGPVHLHKSWVQGLIPESLGAESQWLTHSIYTGIHSVPEASSPPGLLDKGMTSPNRLFLRPVVTSITLLILWREDG